MKRSAKVIALLALLIAVPFIFTSCSIDMNTEEQSKISEALSGKEIEYFLDDGSVIYSMSDPDAYTRLYYRYYPEEDKISKLRDIENVKGRGEFVRYENNLFFSWGQRGGEEFRYGLYSIDQNTNAITSYPDSKEAPMGILSEFLIGKNISALESRYSGDVIYTHIGFYNPETGEYRKAHECMLDTLNNTGSKIRQACSDGENLYLLIEEYKPSGVVDTYIRKFDKNGNEISSLIIPEEIENLTEEYSGFARMEVFGEYIYLANSSVFGTIAKLNDDGMQVILQDKALQLPFDYDPMSGVDPIFYVNGFDNVNTCYILDPETGKIKEINLDIDGGAELFHMYQNKDSYIVKIIHRETHGYSTYIVPSDELGRAKFGGEDTVYYRHYLIEQSDGTPKPIG